MPAALISLSNRSFRFDKKEYILAIFAS